MHEVELATRVLKALHQISAGRGARVLEVNLRVGEINEPRSLGLWLKKLGHPPAGARAWNCLPKMRQAWSIPNFGYRARNYKCET